ncbi:glycosyltransferase family 25 protein [Vibrio sp. RE86]|uniref:glycosyltransferase family 25 protein n=1 Tax=Vibrio sp. RE86 TaxID=2607605 RepID=UPI0014936690|nr:glycosyltransferase family 25 protein [Vibrio sp. RE86]
MKVFVISLKRSPERREYIKKQLDDLGIEFEFFDAVDGRAEPPHPLFENYDYTKRLWLTNGRMPSKGEMGCYASHYLIWEECVKSNNSILVIEDDVMISPEFKRYIPVIESELNEFGFLRLESEHKKCKLWEKKVHKDYSISFMTNNFGGTISYAIHPSSASKLLSGSKSWCLPVDNYIGSLYIHEMPSYIFLPSLVSNPDSFETTIQLGEESRPPWYRKPTRELYSLYRKIMMKKGNKSYL